MDEEMQRALGGGTLSGARGEGVTVAVFDTWPADPPPLNAPHGRAIADPWAKILRPKVGGASIPALARAASAPLVSAVYEYTGTTPAGTVIPCAHSADGAKLDVASHGLFVAGIIKEIAPNADVRVYRVLGDDGIGDLHTLVEAIADAINHADGRPLLLNCSLGFGPQLALLDALFSDPKLRGGDLAAWQQAIANTPPPATPAAEVDDLLAKHVVEQNTASGRYNFIHGLEIIDHVFAPFGARSKTLAIAAAGNDSRDGKLPFGPRVPAAIESVLAVSSFNPRGATALDWHRAGYSNNDDLFQNNLGVGAFGGLVADIGREPVSEHGLIGLYAGEMIPDYTTFDSPPAPAPVPNTTGYALWSGSSFAAPVAAGFAACLWSERPAAGAGDVFGWLTTQPGGNRRYLPFRQR